MRNVGFGDGEVFGAGVEVGCVCASKSLTGDVAVRVGVECLKVRCRGVGVELVGGGREKQSVCEGRVKRTWCFGDLSGFVRSGSQGLDTGNVGCCFELRRGNCHHRVVRERNGV